MHLDAERGAIHAAIRTPRLDDRGQQRDPRLGLRVAGHAEPVQRRARLQRQQPAGEGDGADLRQHPGHVRVGGDGTAALDPLGRIGLGERQRPRALRHALHADAQARRVHHGEHGVEAAIRLADQLRLGAVEQHDAGGRGVDAELALDAAAAERVALPVRQHLRRGEERDAARPWRRVRQPREHEVQRVLRQVVLAPGDEDLLAVQPVAAVTRRLGAGADLGKVAARLRLGEAHGAGPLAGDEPRQPRLGLLRRRVALQRLDRAGGEQGEEAERHVRGADEFLHRHPKRLRQPLAAMIGGRRQPLPAALHPAAIRVLVGRRHAHHTVLIDRAVPVRRLRVRPEPFAREPLRLLDDGLDVLRPERRAGSGGQPGQVDEPRKAEDEVLGRRRERGSGGEGRVHDALLARPRLGQPRRAAGLTPR